MNNEKLSRLSWICSSCQRWTAEISEREAQKSAGRQTRPMLRQHFDTLILAGKPLTAIAVLTNTSTPPGGFWQRLINKVGRR